MPAVEYHIAASSGPLTRIHANSNWPRQRGYEGKNTNACAINEGPVKSIQDVMWRRRKTTVSKYARTMFFSLIRLLRSYVIVLTLKIRVKRTRKSRDVERHANARDTLENFVSYFKYYMPPRVWHFSVMKGLK